MEGMAERVEVVRLPGPVLDAIEVLLERVRVYTGWPVDEPASSLEIVSGTDGRFTLYGKGKWLLTRPDPS